MRRVGVKRIWPGSAHTTFFSADFASSQIEDLSSLMPTTTLSYRIAGPAPQPPMSCAWAVIRKGNFKHMGRVNAKPTLKHQTVAGRPTHRSAFLLLPSTLPHNPLIENGKERHKASKIFWEEVELKDFKECGVKQGQHL